MLKTRPYDALTLYAIALDNARMYAANATSGAEGSMRAYEERKLEQKVERFRNEMKKWTGLVGGLKKWKF